MLLLLMVLTRSAVADCAEPDQLLDRAEAEILERKRSDAQASFQEALAALQCSAPPLPDQVARLRMVEGVLFELETDTDSATRSFRAAHRLLGSGSTAGGPVPNTWVEQVGPTFKELWQQAGRQPTAGNATITLSPDPLPETRWIDGTPVGPTTRVPAGVHLVQVASADGSPLFTQSITVTDQQDLVVETGVVAGHRQPTALEQRASRRWERTHAKLVGKPDAKAELLLERFLVEFEPQAEAERIWLPAVHAAQQAMAQLNPRWTPPAAGEYNGGPRLSPYGFLGGNTMVTAAPRATTIDDLSPHTYGGGGVLVEAGVAVRLSAAVGLRAAAGYRGTFGPGSEPAGLDRRTHHAVTTWVAGTLRAGPLGVIVGPTFEAGPASAFVELSSDLAVPLSGSIERAGARAQLDLAVIGAGPLWLGPAVGAAVTHDGERAVATSEIGVALRR